MRSLERHLLSRLLHATKPCFTVYVAASTNAARALQLQRASKDPADILRGLFSAFPALPKLWSVLIANWRSSVAEFLRRLARDRHDLARLFFRSEDCGEVLSLRAGLSDPHRGGRTVLKLRFRCGRLIYKPRSGHGEQAWFDALGWLNAHGFFPIFGRLQVLDRQDYCWMEAATPRACRGTAGVRRFYRRVGGMLALAHRFGAVDCHRDNLIASGEHPFLVDAETLLHARPRGGASLPLLFRTGFLPLPPGAPGAEFSASALSAAPGPHHPALDGALCDAWQFQAELVEGFRLAHSLLSGSADCRRTFTCLLRKLEKLDWRQVVRPTTIYAELCERSLQPSALRSLVERERLIRIACERPGVSERMVRTEITAISQLDIPYFTGRSKAAEPDVTAEPSLRELLDQSFTR